ncbi:MAG: hypothetical protein Q9171_002836 [Xanthocarpia ochracea]
MGVAAANPYIAPEADKDPTSDNHESSAPIPRPIILIIVDVKLAVGFIQFAPPPVAWSVANFDNIDNFSYVLSNTCIPPGIIVKIAGLRNDFYGAGAPGPHWRVPGRKVDGLARSVAWDYAMSGFDFADIPAAGDALIESEPARKYRFNGRYMHAMWANSTISTKEEFQTKLLRRLPSNIQYFGGRVLHQDGTPHYHVVIKFDNKVHWPDAAKHLRIEGDTNAIRIETPRSRQPVGPFLEDTQSHCSEDGDTFGERISPKGAVSERKKRMWQQFVDEPDEDLFSSCFGTDNICFLTGPTALVTTRKPSVQAETEESAEDFREKKRRKEPLQEIHNL